MKRLRHILFNALVIQSLVLCLVMAALWVRSYSISDQLYWSQQSLAPWTGEAEQVAWHELTVWFRSLRGRLGGAVRVQNARWLETEEAHQRVGIDYAYQRLDPKVMVDSTYFWYRLGFDYETSTDKRGQYPNGTNSSVTTNLKIWIPTWFAMLLCMICPAIWLLRWRRARRLVSRQDAEISRET